MIKPIVPTLISGIKALGRQDRERRKKLRGKKMMPSPRNTHPRAQHTIPARNVLSISLLS